MRVRFAPLRLLTLVLVISAVLFAVLAEQVSRHQGLIHSDPRLLADVIGVRNGFLTVLAKVVTNLGTAVAYLLLTAVGGWYWHRKRTVALPLAALAWMAVGLLLRVEISRAIARPRPSPGLRLVAAGGFAFPSGHTATATVGFGLMALLLWRVSSSSRRKLFVALAVFAVLAVGLSRVYLGVHWPTDVLGGWIFGIGWVTLGALIYRLASRRSSA
jgi:membrane-associated phospholipid phosphatase